MKIVTKNYSRRNEHIREGDWDPGENQQTFAWKMDGMELKLNFIRPKHINDILYT